MSLQIYKNTTNELGGKNTLLITGAPNWAEGWTVQTTNKPQVGIMSDTTSSIDRPRTIQTSVSSISDVYRNFDIDPSYQAPSKRGTRIAKSLMDVWSVKDSENPGYRVDLPYKATLAIEVPNNELLTDSDIWEIVSTLVGSLCSWNGTADSEVASLIPHILRGNVNP